MSELNGFRYSVLHNEETKMYGILCLDEKGNTIEIIDDITENVSVIDEFCNMLNSSEVYPCHFYDIYEDFFA